MAEVQWLDEEEARAWRSFIRMSDVLRTQLARDLQQESGLSEADYAVLVQLSDEPEGRLRMTDLATRMLWSKSRLSHQIGRMESRGLVRKEDCPSDARGAFAALTPAGFAEIRRAAPAHVESVRRHFINLLNSEQLAQLGLISDRVLSHLMSLGVPDELTAAGATKPCPTADLRPTPDAQRLGGS
jgi:DNA-binding MarR family transcriptional regulator